MSIIYKRTNPKGYPEMVEEKAKVITLSTDGRTLWYVDLHGDNRCINTANLFSIEP